LSRRDLVLPGVWRVARFGGGGVAVERGVAHGLLDLEALAGAAVGLDHFVNINGHGPVLRHRRSDGQP